MDVADATASPVEEDDGTTPAPFSEEGGTPTPSQESDASETTTTPSPSVEGESPSEPLLMYVVVTTGTDSRFALDALDFSRHSFYRFTTYGKPKSTRLEVHRCARTTSGI